jgi:prolyl 4-hydroxylase
MKKVEFNKDVFVIQNFLSIEECNDLIRDSELIGYEEAKVQAPGNRQIMLKNVRNNDRIMYENNQLANELFEKAKPFLIHSIGNYDLIGLNEMFRFYKYSKGQSFKMHKDGSYERNETECSFYTFLIYLNDDFDGGETEFENLFTVNPKTGDLLVFYHPLRHEGKEVTSGFKYALRSDVMYKLRNIE